MTSSVWAGFSFPRRGEPSLWALYHLAFALYLPSAPSAKWRQPLTYFANSEQRLAEINDALLKTAWSEPLAGQFVYASTSSRQELKPIPGVNAREGILVVEPGPYGLSGKILRELPGNPTSEQTAAELSKAVASFTRRPAEYSSHIQLGIQLGIDWESAIPETDQQSIRAKERARAGN